MVFLRFVFIWGGSVVMKVFFAVLCLELWLDRCSLDIEVKDCGPGKNLPPHTRSVLARDIPGFTSCKAVSITGFSVTVPHITRL